MQHVIKIRGIIYAKKIKPIRMMVPIVASARLMWVYMG